MRQFIGSVRDATTVQDFLVGLAAAPVREAWATLQAAELALMDRDDERTQLDYAHALTHWGDVGGYDAEVLWDTVTVAALGMPYERVQVPRAGDAVRRRAEAARARTVAARTGRGAAARRAGQLPRRPGQAVARGAAARDAKTVLFVSHDRELLAQVADRIVTVEGGTAWVHGGGFASYHEARDGQARADGRAAPSLGRGARAADRARAHAAAAGQGQRGHGRRSTGSMARRLERFEAAGPPPDKPDRAAGHDAPARRAHRRARRHLRRTWS